MIKRILTPILVSLIFALSLGAASGEKQYFLGDAKAIIAQIPAPPADDSPAGLADLETLLQVQKDRTPEQVARAKRIASHSAMQMGSVAFGPDFTKENFPRTAALMKELSDARGKAVGSGKKYWERPRPFVRCKDVVVATSMPTTSSYPSGHSSSGAFWGAMFSAAFPEYKNLFDAEVRETMWCRVLAGVHFPSDTTAGRLLGNLTAAEMLKAPDTQTAIAEIRAEVTAYLKTHPDVQTRADKLAAEAAEKIKK